MTILNMYTQKTEIQMPEAKILELEGEIGKSKNYTWKFQHPWTKRNRERIGNDIEDQSNVINQLGLIVIFSIEHSAQEQTTLPFKYTWNIHHDTSLFENENQRCWHYEVLASM